MASRVRGVISSYGNDFVGNYSADNLSLGVVKYLYDHPEGIDPPISARNCAHIKNCNDFSAVVAKKGDVILLHGLLPHAASPNFLHYARVISNPHVSMHEPYNLNREDGNYVCFPRAVH